MEFPLPVPGTRFWERLDLMLPISAARYRHFRHIRTSEMLPKPANDDRKKRDNSDGSE